jgi:periplasmic divalent cation tolerance protein
VIINNNLYKTVISQKDIRGENLVKISLAYVTFPSKNIAEDISSKIIKEKLAKCVNFFNIDAMYEWKGKIEKNKEIVGIFKLNSSLFSKFSKKMLKLHPYEAPCIIKINPSDVNKEYSNWIGELK